MVVLASAVPDRTLAQRMAALAIGNDIRSWRATLKRDLAAGRVSLRSVLLDVPEKAETMKVFDLLVATPAMGRVKANRALQMARISPSKSLAGLTGRQRRELLSVLAGFPSVMRGMVAA